MNVLHITTHLGGGLGSVIIDFLRVNPGHTLVTLDTINHYAKRQLIDYDINFYEQIAPVELVSYIEDADIVLVHWYCHPLLNEFILTKRLPACRLIFWCHQNVHYDKDTKAFPDKWINTSPIQGSEPFIRSTRDMTPFLAIEKEEHEGFNVGYIGTVDYKKMHYGFIGMCLSVDIPDINFYIIGDNKLNVFPLDPRFIFTGKVDDVKPYLAKMDVFGYPLRDNHYGTCEQALGEAMCAGVPPIVLNNPAEDTIVISGFSGIIADSITDYSEAIKHLAENKSIQSWLGYNAKKDGAILYKHEYMLNEWYRVFTETMQQPKRSR